MRKQALLSMAGVLVMLGGALTSSGAFASVSAGSGNTAAAKTAPSYPVATKAAARTKIASKLLEQFNSSPDARVDYLVWMADQPDTSNNISDWKAKGEYVLHKLEAAARSSQPAVKTRLEAQRMSGNLNSFQGYTIVNAIGVKGGNLASAEAAAELPGVQEVRAVRVYRPEPIVAERAVDQPEASPYGILKIMAPQVWAQGFRGEGITVGSIDTGVRYTHEAVNRQYRGNLGAGAYDHNYNWWDSTAANSPAPYDDHSHGTHTVGTVMGDNGDPGTEQIGVAPHAKWIAAKVFPGGGSSNDTEILPSMDFMLAPWPVNQPYQNRRPDLRPRIVNNSWGDTYCPNMGEYTAVQNWVSAGIFPSFSNGNEGPSAATVGSPAAYPMSFGVGATNSTDTIASFSSRGPSCYGGILKPDVSAPGVSVRSAVNSSDTAYANFSGTSMAAPHNSGSTALIYQARPSLTISDVMSIITRTADFNPAIMGTRPNNNYGWGRLNVNSAVEYARHAPQITGTVTFAAQPVLHANVQAVRTDGDQRLAISAADGTYKMTIGAGTYNVTVSAFGFNPITLQNQVYVSDTNYLRNIDLTPLVMNNLHGNVLAATVGTPISATITVDGSPYVYHTDPGTGAYTIALPAGTWRLHIDAGLSMQKTMVVTVNGNRELNIMMRPNRDTMYASGQAAFNWVPGTTQVTDFTPYFAGVSASEEGYASLALPFGFKFYGTTYNTLYVDSNSVATFQQPTADDLTYVPTTLPSADSIDAVLALYWRDTALGPVGNGNQGAVYTAVTGSAPNRTFVVEYRNIASLGGSSSYELLLKEGSNQIVYQYQNMDGDFGHGYNATIGIENQDGTSGVQSAYRQPGEVGNNTAVSYTPCNLNFADVAATDYFYIPLRYLSCLNPPAISGYSDGTFRPYNNTTRSQLAKIVVSAFGFVPFTPSSPTFSDVPTSNPFYQYIETAVHNGIISGYADGTFRPYNDVTRGQLAKIVTNAAGWTLVNPAVPTFIDTPPTHPFYTYVETAVAHGVIGGYSDRTFRPQNNATRGQIAKIVYLALVSE